ncbi:MAG: AAA family ATPase [Gammaproteobacteria bacterium]
MLLEFGAKNFYSFDEGFEASFRLNNNCPVDISKGLEASTVMCVKGANASGKTNVLRVLAFLVEFCCNSFSKKPEEKIKVVPHFSKQALSEFYIVFSVNGSEYRYELAVSPEKVDQEKLFLDGTLVVERNKNEFVSLKKEFDSLETVKLRNNASFISTANQYEVEATKDIYFAFWLFVVSVEDVGRKPPISYQDISWVYHKDEVSFRFAKDIISKCDLGVKDIEIVKKENEKGEQIHSPVFSHQTRQGTQKLSYDSQSSGTKTLYDYLLLYSTTLEDGRVLVLDEFDINLHPHILPLLVDLFDKPETNPQKAQLIFTTHNSAIMDDLGKYRTLMVQKKNNTSFVYRLDEIPGDMLRNDRKITPLYEARKIGGVPII